MAHLTLGRSVALLGHAVAVFDDPRDSLWLNIIVLIARFRIYSNSGQCSAEGMAREKL